MSKTIARREKLAKRVAAYAAAATAASTAATQDVQAAVIYEDIQDVVIQEATPGGGIVAGFDLDNNGSVDFEFGHQLLSGTFGMAVAGTGENLTGFPNTTANQIAANAVTINGDTLFYLRNLSQGTIVDSSLTSLSTLGSFNRGYLAYGATSSCLSCEFSSETDGLLGLSFDANGTTNYGWMRVKIDDGDRNRMTVLSYAYEDTGAPIAAGSETAVAVPEPGCLGLLALGGAGLMAWRRRYQQLNTSARDS